MPHAPFKGRWTPVPDAAGGLLLAQGKHHAFIVWVSMLRDATASQSWLTSRPISAIMRETALSKNTVRKAQQELVADGYIEAAGGGNGAVITYALTAIENYGKHPVPDKKDNPKPVGNWKL